MKAAEKLKAIRKEINISGARLAALINVGVNTYNSWEHQSKRLYLPIEHVKKLLPALVKLGVSPATIWDLGGVDLSLLLPDDHTTVTLDDGSVAEGLSTDGYFDAKDLSGSRRMGPGMTVVAMTEGPSGVKTTGLFEIGDNKTLIPVVAGQRMRPLLYVPTGDWYQGTIGIGPKTSKCHILLVVRRISTQYNENYL